MTTKTNSAKSPLPAKRGTGPLSKEATAPVAKRQATATKRRAAADASNANDLITVVKPAESGNAVVACSAKRMVAILPWQDKGSTRKLAVIGGSLSALEAHLATLVKPTAKLANGVDSHNSPHSAKAVADQKRAAPVENKGKSRAAKADKAKAPSRGTNRRYAKAGRKDESKPGTFRTYMLATIMGSKDTDSAKAAHAKSGKYPTHKLDFNWAAQQGYIKFVD